MKAPDRIWVQPAVAKHMEECFDSTEDIEYINADKALELMGEMAEILKGMSQFAHTLTDSTNYDHPLFGATGISLAKFKAFKEGKAESDNAGGDE